MNFKTLASLVLLACATNVAADPQPYKLIKAPVEGLSLARRSTPGYQPEQSTCGDGSTCAEACGQGYETCPSNDDSTHCYNPLVKQKCCSDGTGNSCDDGYYCTHDTKSQTWCCPDSMDLVQCAAAYGVKDGLETDSPLTTSKPATTASELKTISTTVLITSTSLPTPETTSTTPTTIAVPTTKAVTAKTKTEVVEKTTTPCPSSGYSTAWRGSNSTIASAVPTQPSETGPAPIETTATSEPTQATGGAATTGVSALLLVAAGVFALL
ncbi:hypothetical protein NCS56_00264000 [Fusarium sp. Ph1]|nr:hypothetical protein NCS56_00264000 [Fusarium sp. Ph1]